jgi:predicted transposase YdaD
MSWEENSVTYQAILAQGEAKGAAKGEIAGRIEEARALLLRLGARRVRHPSSAIESQIEAIADLTRLESMIERTIDAASWEELLAV